MKKINCNVDTEGFYGIYTTANENANSAIIAVSDNDAKGFMAKSIAKWINDTGTNSLNISPEKKDSGCHSFPMEQIQKAIQYLKSNGNQKIGILGVSATGMIALTASSLFHDITLTIALTPSDFVMEGYYQDKKDGARERPGDFESSLTWQGKPLAFLPYAYRHPEYWQKHIEESKRRGALTAARDMFDESERQHPLQEDEKIKVENIKGHIYFAASEDDVLWDSCKYIRRMANRLEELPHNCTYEKYLYEHGTHFVFPEGMIKKILPFGVNLILPKVFKEAKGYTDECQKTREDIQQTLTDAIYKWQKNQ